MEKWDGNERRKGQREFCQQHITMTNDIVEIKTILLGIKQELTQGITFKTAMIGAVILVILAIIGQAVLYGRLIEKVDDLKSMKIEIKNLQVSQAEDHNQIQVNTQRWNRLLEKNPVIVQDKLK